MTNRFAGPALLFALGLLVAGCSDSSSGGGAPLPPPGGGGGGGGGTGSVTITAVDPASAGTSGGDMIAIQGTGFNSTTTVQFGSVQATVVAGSSTLLVVTTPPGAGTLTMTVTTGGDSATRSFTFGGQTGTDVYQFKTGTEKWWLNVEFAPQADADGNGLGDLSEALVTLQNNAGGVGFNDFQGAVQFLFQFTSQFYRNNPDGSLLTGGTPISFRRGNPQFGNNAPAGFAINPVSALDYNIMAIRKVGHIQAGEEQTGVAGRASSEVNSNDTLENNSGGTTPGGQSDPPLGTFSDAAAHFWNVSAIPTSRRTLEQFMEEVAQITAHEIGHSMGLLHTNATPPAPANVNMMSPSVTFDTTNVYDFDATTYSGFLGYMPGPTRLVHRSAWSPRRLVQNADAIVIGQPRVTGGEFAVAVESVLGGDVAADALVNVFDLPRLPGSAEATASGTSLFFLARAPGGGFSASDDAYGISLSGHDRAEWEALVADYVALRALEGDRAAWLAAYADRARRSLVSADARVRVDALFELSVERDVVRALPAAAIERLHELVTAGASLGERKLAATAFVHLADAAQAVRLRQAALATDDLGLLATLAGALEASQGLAPAAAGVRAALADTGDANVARRGRVLLGWLLDAESTALIAQDLGAGGDLARRAADALGRIGDPAALPALQALALDAAAPLRLRQHALRAIGRIGGDDAAAWLTARVDGGSGALADAARFARDYPLGWRIEGR